jgi:phosphopantothenoylcysteine decarboxylase / phosphopantothenate---cysteine ligase
MLENKNIIIGVTGSIAIYKTLELIRLFIKQKANVKVIMTKSSQKFISKLTFETISQQMVLDDTSESWSNNSINNHINISKWADIFIIAPASANTINKIANGISDNILTQTILASKNKKLLVPAANTNMIKNKITKKNLLKLKNLKYTIIKTQIKQLACKDIGYGAMAEPIEIFYQAKKILLQENYWKNRETIITGGGTIEQIDQIRYISNFSSGKMASSLALALYLKGAKVTLISTKGYENLPLDIKVIPVKNSIDILKTLSIKLKSLNNIKKPYLFMAAAISDYIPLKILKGKLKKDILGTKWSLKLKKNIDILKTINKEQVYSVGFKAETNKKEALKNAKKMLEDKNLNHVCLNIINNKNRFGSDENYIKLLSNEPQINKIKGHKIDISFKLLKLLKLCNKIKK